MSWSAKAKVVDANATSATLTASGADITNTGDDTVGTMTLQIGGTDMSHLVVGAEIEITADC